MAGTICKETCMFLTVTNIVHYLLERGVVSPATVVNGQFTAIEAGRRNRNYRIVLGDAAGLFVKQINTFDAMAISTLHREAACYRIARDNPAYADLRALMTRFIDHDATRHCLIVELLDGAENLNEYFARTRSFPAHIAQRIGSGLGGCHRAVQGRPLQSDELATFPRYTPWILSYHHGHTFPAGSLSGGAVQVAEVIRRHPELYANFDRLRSEWRYDAIIHGDMKWDNCLVCPDGAGGQTIKIIDWELVDCGDACWDVGGFFQSFLTSWIYSMPIPYETAPQRLVSGAAHSLDAMQPAISAFWRGYREGAAIPGELVTATLKRSIEYCAARMVQTAFESLFSSPTVNNHATSLLQVALNILRDPKEAASALFGLEMEGSL